MNVFRLPTKMKNTEVQTLAVYSCMEHVANNARVDIGGYVSRRSCTPLLVLAVRRHQYA